MIAERIERESAVFLQPREAFVERIRGTVRKNTLNRAADEDIPSISATISSIR